MWCGDWFYPLGFFLVEFFLLGFFPFRVCPVHPRSAPEMTILCTSEVPS